MTDSPSREDRARSIAVLVTALTQVVAAPLTPLLLGAGANTGSISDANRTAATPAGYAFSIWGLIYLASLALAVYQLLRPTTPANRASGWWLAWAFACSTVWVPVFGVGLIWLSQIIIFALVAFLGTALFRLTRLGPAADRGERWLLRIPTGLYLGWAICASAAGFALMLRSFGMGEVGPVPIGVSLVMVAAAVAACLIVVLRLDAVAGFTFTAVWALVAIAVGTFNPAVRIAAVVGVVAVAAVLVVRTAQSTRKDVILLG